MMRKTLFAVAGLLGAILLVAGATLVWLFTSLPNINTTYSVAGLTASVDIVRDTHGIPHIYAQSARDGYFALGFVHAQDRLWQMEMMRRHASGRLAEVLGPRALASDRLMRVLGLARLAEAQYDALETPLREALQAYAAGVNAWRQAHWGALPPEFLFLGFSPEPWRPSDSLLWGKVMAFRLSGNWQDELLRARMSHKLPADKVAQLWPERPPDAVQQLGRLPDLLGDRALANLAAALPPLAPARGASNAWVIAGTHTGSKKPILANDPHLGFAAPILWYLTRIETPELSLAGATVPGVPFLILGHNGHIAWGMTATQADLQDLFVEQVESGDESRYRTPDGAQAFAARPEVIRVRGGADVSLTVRATRHGPVISDVAPAAQGIAGEGKVLALAATFLRDDDRTPHAIFRLNQARTWDEFRAALADFHAPVQSIHYADTAGNIGFLAPGRVPVRKSGQGWVPSPGWSGEADWIGFVPFEHLPRLFNPREGRIVSANNKIVADDYPYFLSHDWAPGYRARRIHQILDEEKAQSLDNQARIQRDIVSVMAQELLPLMTDIKPTRESLEKVLIKMREWSGSMARRQPEPLIFSYWLRELNRALYADELGELFPRYFDLHPRFVANVLRGDHAWCDDVTTPETEDCKSRVGLALERAVSQLAKTRDAPFVRWRWGDAHRARFAHPLFSDLPIVGARADLAIDTDGAEDTVNRGASRVDDERAPFAAVHGPGMRAIYDLGNLDQSRFMIATGQSGNPLSAHYRDLLTDWRDGRYLRLGLNRRALQAAAKGTLRLEPKS
jgi:penicillin amidase